MIRFNFWKRVRDYAIKRMHETHLGSAQRCPNCLCWTWDMPNGPKWSKFLGKGIHTAYMVCTYCGYRSKWLDIGMGGLMLLDREYQVAKRRLESLDIQK